MSFFKHIGTANGAKKVIIVQRELPGELHMAGVIYSEIIPSRFHDDIMKELESDAGQAAHEFKDILERRFFSDGRNMLEALYAEGYIKKVASNNVIVRPNSKSAIRLDELNKMLNDIRTGKIATDEIKAMEAEPSVTAPVKSESAPASSDDDRMARLEKLVMGLAETVSTLASDKKGPGRPKKNATPVT